MPENPFLPKVSLLRAALLCRCPKCGQGRLFDGLLAVRERCPVCALDLRGSDAGDGATVAVIFLLSIVIMAAAFWVEFHLSPPLWVHVVLWPIVAIPLAIFTLRPLKAGLVGLQYRHRAAEMGL